MHKKICSNDYDDFNDIFLNVWTKKKNVPSHFETLSSQQARVVYTLSDMNLFLKPLND